MEVIQVNIRLVPNMTPKDLVNLSEAEFSEMKHELEKIVNDIEDIFKRYQPNKFGYKCIKAEENVDDTLWLVYNVIGPTSTKFKYSDFRAEFIDEFDMMFLYTQKTHYKFEYRVISIEPEGVENPQDKLVERLTHIRNEWAGGLNG